jgi:hypothetical protein
LTALPGNRNVRAKIPLFLDKSKTGELLVFNRFNVPSGVLKKDRHGGE